MTDERRDDEVLGRALSRAIETIEVNQTPFERSRVATAPARRSIFGLWQVATAAAAIVLALAIGSWLTRPTDGQPGVAASPIASLGTQSPTSATPIPTPAPTPPAPTLVDHARVYFGRDGLPPISTHVEGITATTPESRIAARLAALGLIPPANVPAGAVNPFSLVGKPSMAVTVTAQGDAATVEFDLASGWGVHGAAQSQALLQQLVYTITEEPGIRTARIVERGKTTATIDQLIVKEPLAREDVFGYKNAGAIGSDKALTWAGDDTIPHVVAKLTSFISDGATTRLTFLGTSGNTEAPTALPSFSIALESFDDSQPVGGKTAAALNGGKYQLRVEFQWNGGGSSGGIAGTTVVDQTPLRAIIGANPITLIELDDARPWRAWMPDKTQLVVEIGGDPRATSDRIAVTAPKPGAIVNSGADLILTGAARVFEANVVWRVLDPAGKVVANGHFNASLGSSALWGTFNARIPMPANVRGNLTLEVFETSPKDGTAQGVVQIPLSVR